MHDTILILPPTQSTAGAQLLSGALQYAKLRQWKVQLIEDRSRRAIAAARREFKPIGCLLGGDLRLSSADNSRSFSALHGLPVVGLDWQSDNIGPLHNSAHDSEDTGRRAAKELLDLRLASYAYIPWTKNRKWCKTRHRGFESLVHAERKSLYSFPETIAHGKSRSARLKQFLKEIPKPAGIFAANDRVAWECINAVDQLGLSVPHDIAIIGVDNDVALCENISPGITSIVPDFEHGGYLAAALLDELIADPTLPPETRSFGSLSIIRRGSTTRIVKDTRIEQALQLIHERATKGLSASDVILSIGGSRRYAEQRFHSVVGKTILEVINECRLEAVKTLLAKPDMKIGDIAKYCGWTNANFLRKLFKSRTGVTMQQWRDRITRSSR